MKNFKVMPGVIIFFHFRNGSISHLTWKDDIRGSWLPWNENDQTQELGASTLSLKDERECMHFMTFLADMYHGLSIGIQKIPIIGSGSEENGHGIIAIKFV